MEFYLRVSYSIGSTIPVVFFILYRTYSIVHKYLDTCTLYRRINRVFTNCGGRWWLKQLETRYIYVIK